jgi:hypothetical protein
MTCSLLRHASLRIAVAIGTQSRVRNCNFVPTVLLDDPLQALMPQHTFVLR